MTMQIKSIILYNSQGETRQLDFQLGKINIIAGGSSTGKSAIIPIIEYCLGLSDFHVPGTDIRNTVACYAVVYTIAGIDILIAKRPPSGNRTKEFHAFYRENPEVIPLPLNTLAPNTNDDEINLRLTRLLHTASDQQFEPVRISQATSIIDTHAFLFQRSTVIASDSILFHKQENRSKEIKASLPYFLGIVRETDLALEQNVEDARKALNRARRQFNDENRQQRELVTKGQSLVVEAQELGLLSESTPNDVKDVDSFRTILNTAITKWQPSITPPAIDDPRLPGLKTEMDQLKQEHSRIRMSLEATKTLQKEVAGYTEQAEEQRLRLRSINLFATQNPFDFAESRNQCPLCLSELQEADLHIPQIAAIRKALNKLEGDLLSVRREQPAIEEQIHIIEDQLSQKQREIDRKQLEISAILRQTQATDNIIQEITRNNSRIDRVIGRIELYLEMANTDSLTDLDEQRQEAEAQFSTLENQVAARDIENSKRRILNQLADQMTQWAQNLGMDQNGRYILDIDNLSVLVDDENQTYVMSEIGGGANYLKFHLITLLALHKHFIQQSRPVPGFILLDQPSQVFFPSSKDYETIQNPSLEANQLRSGEIAAAQEVFNFLFNVCEQLNPNLQIIILEHAYFDSRFKDALVNNEDWFGGRALIPQSWIDNITSSFQQGKLLDNAIM